MEKPCKNPWKTQQAWGSTPVVEASHLRMEDAAHLLTGLKILARSMDGWMCHLEAHRLNSTDI